MAGRPKRRARIESQRTRAADAGIPDAVPSRAPARAPAHDARAHEQAEAQPVERSPRGAPTALRSPLIGAGTRAAADDAQAQTMRQLAELIKPGVEVRIERSRPTWAAGWIEDFPIASVGDALQDLYQHLRDEHGGQLYKLTVLASGQHPVYVGSVAIAGPVRMGGVKVGREAFEPPARERDRDRDRDRPQPAASGTDMGPMLAAFGQFMGVLLTSQKESAQLQMEAVKDMVRTSQQQTSELTAAVLQVRSDENTRSGLAGQLGELAEAFTAVESVRKRFGAARTEQPEADEMSGALAEATKGFMSSVVQSMAQQRAAAAPRPAPQRRMVMRGAQPSQLRKSQVVGEHAPGIPDAIAGQAARTN